MTQTSYRSVVKRVGQPRYEGRIAAFSSATTGVAWFQRPSQHTRPDERDKGRLRIR